MYNSLGASSGHDESATSVSSPLIVLPTSDLLVVPDSHVLPLDKDTLELPEGESHILNPLRVFDLSSSRGPYV